MPENPSVEAPASGLCGHLLRHWPAWLAFGLMPLVLAFSARGYQGNDDAIIIEVLRTGHPAPFISDAWAVALVHLYRWAGSVSWYGIGLYASLLMGLHMGLRIVQWLTEASPSPLARLLRVVLSGVLLFSVWLMLIRVTYTQAAMVCAGLALVGFIVAWRREKLTWGWATYAGLLWMQGYLWRPAGAMGAGTMVLVLGLLPWALLLWRRRWPPWGRLAVLVLPVLLAVGASKVAERRLSPQEREFRQYTYTRGAVQGFANFETLFLRDPEALRTRGWYSWEFVAMMNYMNFDEDRFPRARIEKLLPLGGVSPMLPWAFSGTQGALATTGLTFLLLLPLLALAWSGRVGSRAWWGSVAAVVLHLVVLGCMITFLARYFRLPPRVSQPLALVAGCAGLACAAWCSPADWLAGPRRWRGVFWGWGALALGAAVALAWWHRESTLFRYLWGPPWKELAPYLLLGAVASAGIAASYWVLRVREAFVPDMARQLRRAGWAAAACLFLLLGIEGTVRLWQAQAFRLSRPASDFDSAFRADFPQWANRRIYSPRGDGLMMEQVDPILSADPSSLRLIITNWNAGSPAFYDTLRAAGLKRGADLFPAMDAAKGTDDEFLLLASPGAMEVFDIYAQRSLNKLVHFEVLATTRWGDVVVAALRDGPSRRIQMTGFAPGSCLPPGHPVQGKAAIFAEP